METAPEKRSPEVKEPAWKLAMRAMARLATIVLTLMTAGGLRWLRGWIFVSLFLATSALGYAVIRWKNPALIRLRLKKIKATKRFDKIFFSLYVAAFLAFLLVAGLDAGRFGWSAVPFRWLWLGVVLHALGMSLIAWAAAVNPYLECTVRIQHERGHTTVTTGPYRWVRHPMYSGILLAFLGWPLVLGSLWSYIPVAAVSVLFVFRTAKEDQTLRAELSGYSGYCRQTRYRLLPAIW